MDIAIARYEALDDEERKLLVYVFPEDEKGAVRVMEGMKKVIDFYLRSFGEVKEYKGYTLIEIPDGFGSQAGDYYALQTASSFKESFPLREVYHEIAHTWNVKAHPAIQRCRWFDEAFAQYLAALAIREFDGQEAFEKEMIRNQESFIRTAQRDSKNVETPIVEYGRYEIGENSYTKGAWVLYVLHRMVGEHEFQQIMRDFFSEYRDRPADFRDFQRIAGQVTGRDLDVFFNEWIYGAESSQYLIDRIPVEEIARKYP